MRISRNNSRRFIDFKFYDRNYGYELSGKLLKAKLELKKKQSKLSNKTRMRERTEKTPYRKLCFPTEKKK